MSFKFVIYGNVEVIMNDMNDIVNDIVNGWQYCEQPKNQLFCHFVMKEMWLLFFSSSCEHYETINDIMNDINDKKQFAHKPYG